MLRLSPPAPPASALKPLHAVLCCAAPAHLAQEGQAPYSWFLAVAISTGVGALVIFAGVMVYCRWTRLI